MHNTRARFRVTLLALSTLPVLPVAGHTQSEGAARSSGPSAVSTESQPATSWSLCGAGVYEVSAAGQSIGSESFEIVCRPDGRYSATGRTQLSAGPTALDLTTTLELGADLVPTAASSKGTVGGRPFDQSGTFANGTATLSTNGTPQSVPYTAGASWMGGNIFFPIAFIVARYDEAKGGVQQFPVFPTMSASVERVATDAIPAEGGGQATFTRFKLGVAGSEMVLWRDAAGRLAAMAVPVQRFTVARSEVSKLVPALLASLTKGSAQPSPSSAAPSPVAIDYSAPAGASFTAEEVTIPVAGAGYTLAGTLLVPKGGTRPYTVAVMVTGSGLQTRDSRISLPGLESYAPFRQIAERLASIGVAVLRADDRGIGGSTGRETLEAATTTTLANDTRAQIAWLRARPQIDPARVIIIGHSEGASIAAMIGAGDPKVFGLILMAGVARRGAEVAVEQQEDMLRADTTMSDSTKAGLRTQQRQAMETVLAGGEVPGQMINAWTREYIAYDPLPTVRKVRQPVLILQGERDRQVDQSHATMLASALGGAGNPRVTLKVFPTLNHLFLPSKTGSVSEYSHLETSTVPAAVIDEIAGWVASLRSR
jgi:uncharacterized protein